MSTERRAASCLTALVTAPLAAPLRAALQAARPATLMTTLMAAALVAAPAAAQTPAAAPAVTPGTASPASPPPASPAAPAATSVQFERLQVTEPFIEMRTGPGRGYPVFFVAEKGAFVTIELRRTDWYRVRTPGPAAAGATEGAKVGWVHRRQLESTLTEAGGSKTFRDILVDDYLARRVEAGVGWGRFKGEPMLKLWGAYRLGETLGIEATLGQVQGVFSGTDFWHASLVSEPWSDKRLSPYFSVGLGKFRNFPNTSLVNARDTDANLGHAGLGLRWYVAERFVARLDWSLYTAFVSDARSLEYRAVTLGISFFF